MISQSVSSLSIIILLSSCSFLNIFSPSPYQVVYDRGGKALLKDHRAAREDFASFMDKYIVNECANNRVPGTKSSHNWSAFWAKRFYFINRDSENPHWYVNYIIQKRKQAGLKDL